MLSTSHSGTRKLKKISPTGKSVVAKQASETFNLEPSCRFVFMATVTKMLGKIAKGQAMILKMLTTMNAE